MSSGGGGGRGGVGDVVHGCYSGKMFRLRRVGEGG